MIRFPKLRGRSYGYWSNASTGSPAPVDTVPTPLPPAGGQRDAISVPASRRVVGGIDAANPGRPFLARTGDDLDSGPIPNRIERAHQARNAGFIGPNGGAETGMSGWPYDGNALRIPHQVIPRRPITVTPFQRTIDTSVTVPAVSVGGPVS